MSAMLSPAVYLRCSENSTENPWNGLACRPEMNPSTMNLALRSSRATWRMASGFKYFSAGPANVVSFVRSEHLGQRDRQAGQPGRLVHVRFAQDPLVVALRSVGQDRHLAIEAVDDHVLGDPQRVVLGALLDV